MTTTYGLNGSEGWEVGLPLRPGDVPCPNSPSYSPPVSESILPTRKTGFRYVSRTNGCGTFKGARTGRLSARTAHVASDATGPVRGQPTIARVICAHSID